MQINRLVVNNFKSFESLDVTLGNLSILIGANASGKSNFIQILKFLRDITRFGLENAIAMQGGIEYLPNATIGTGKNISLKMISNSPKTVTGDVVIQQGQNQEWYEITKTSYQFSIRFGRTRRQWEVVEDALEQTCKFYRGEPGNAQVSGFIGEGKIAVSRLKGNPRFSFQPPPTVDGESLLHRVFELQFTSSYVDKFALGHRHLYVEGFSKPAFFVGAELGKTLDGIAVYDFDPKASKRGQLVTGRAELEEDGSNLAVLLDNILRERRSRSHFYNLLAELLPFADKFRMQKVADTVLITLRERYSKSRSFPAFLLSDGTINLTTLIICLFFVPKAVKIIEEPERNIHPYLMSKIMGLMRDASHQGQVITTTHNPEVVRYARPEELLLVSRNQKGFSEVTRPADNARVKEFLQNDLGMNELYVQNLL